MNGHHTVGVRGASRLAWLAAPLLALAGCAEDVPAPISTATGGNSPSGGSTSTSGGNPPLPASGGTTSGGAPSQGGATTGGTATGGTTTGGTAAGGSAGTPSAGTTSGGSAGAGSGGMGGDAGKAGGASGGSAGASGASSGGAGGNLGGGSAGKGGGNAGGSGGGSVTATPSPGCSKMTARPANGVVTASDRIYDFPASYDGKTPMPLLLALHAAGNPNTQLQSITNGSPLATNYVRVFPKSAGSAWVYNTDLAKVNAVLQEVLADYCIDTSRIFGTGHSSGAQMIVQLLCGGETRFKAVAPVAAGKYCAKSSPVAVMYIQGMLDAQRGNGNGIDVVNYFRDSNSCSTTSVPKTDVPTCTSSFDRMPVTPGCVTYQNCVVPTVWCSHNDNGYNNTDGKQHGWPCFASNAIAAFFQSLP